jgi:hypothetical protein
MGLNKADSEEKIFRFLTRNKGSVLFVKIRGNSVLPEPSFAVYLPSGKGIG